MMITAERKTAATRRLSETAWQEVLVKQEIIAECAYQSRRPNGCSTYLITGIFQARKLSGVCQKDDGSIISVGIGPIENYYVHRRSVINGVGGEIFVYRYDALEWDLATRHYNGIMLADMERVRKIEAIEAQLVAALQQFDNPDDFCPESGGTLFG